MVQHIFLNKYGLLLSLLSLPQLHAFSFPSTFPLHNHHNHLHRVTTFVSTKRFSSPPKKDEYIYNQIELHKQQEQQEQQQTDVVRSPLRFLGPGYSTIPLRFPHLATSSQRSRNITGVSLDFVLDTAANTNTINAQVAKELELEKVGEAPGGVSAGGGMVGGDTFLLGECELDLSFGREFFKGMVDESESDGDESYDDSNGEEDEAQDHEKEKREEFIFMQGLTASALPVASPAAAGLLSLAFFHCFEGGVEFHWGTPTNSIGENKNNDTAIIPPSITFYGSSQHLNLDGMTRIPFESLPVSMLPSVTLNINGVEIPALFDTGSPITVLNARAAEAVGINTCIPLDELDPTLKKQSSSSGSPWNPFDKLAKSVKSASKIAEATARGNILAIAGSDGRPVRLVKSLSPLEVRLATFSAQEDNASDDTCSSSVTLGQKNVYIGDLPGLAALGGLGGDSAPPAAVLGMDLIRCATRVVFRAQQNEIYI